MDKGSFVIRPATVQMNRTRRHPEKDTLQRHEVGFQVGQARTQYAHIVRMIATIT